MAQDMTSGMSFKRLWGWWIVVASMVGLSCGPGPFIFGTMGIFTLPLANEFGWDRAEISLALTILTFATAISSPVAGRLVDLYGARKVLIPCLLVFAACLFALSYFNGPLWLFYLIFLVIGTAAVGTNSGPYMQTISNWFIARRGFAIGIAMAGFGLGYMYVPTIVQHVISTQGWRGAYATLGFVILLVTVPLVLVFIRNKPEDVGTLPDGGKTLPASQQAEQDFSLTRAEAMGFREFWFLVALFFLFAFALGGSVPHIVPMLIDRGVEVTHAAYIFTSLGAAVFLGRIVLGYLMDKFFAPRVALVFFMISFLGLGMFWVGVPNVYMAALATFFIGLGFGAEFDLLAYLSSRYFGLKSFGEIYGVLFAVVLIGTAMGPYIYGLGYETFGDYRHVLLIALSSIFVGIVLLCLMRPYAALRSAGTSTRP